MKRSLLIALFVAVIVPPDLRSAHASSPDASTGRDEAPLAGVFPPNVAERAGISLEQQREIARMAADSNGKYEELRKAHRSAQQALDLLLRKPHPPEAAVMTQLERIGAAETQLRKNRVALLLQVRRLLGPELYFNLERELEYEKQRVAQRAPGGAGTQPALGTDTGAQPGRIGDPIEVESVSGTLRSEPR